MTTLDGKTIRGYELKAQVAAGGMGAVYKALQPVLKREVAVKVILPQFASQPDFIRRFEVEAEVVASLESPHIVPLYDYWRDPEGAYLVMRWLPMSLKQRLEQGNFTLAEAQKLVDQIAGALMVAHRHGVIHRDLKPGNILLDSDGNAYLADFGIAKVAVHEDDTEAGTVVGSIPYASPEQITGDPVDPTTDIYSFGLMVFEILTGSHPFAADTITTTELLFKQLNDHLPSIRDQISDLPPELDDVIQKATEKNPEERYPSVLSFATAFRTATQSFHGDIVYAEGGLTDTRTWIPNEEWVDLRNPYKGLKAFQESDASDFYGRQALVDLLLSRMQDNDPNNRFLAVVGPSGSGKSSVVKAGLLPALRQGGLPMSDQWFIVEMFPGTHPLEELESALLRVSVAQMSLMDVLKEGERGLARAVKRILPADPNVELLLVIDQFEELFTLVEDEQARTQFLEMLVAVASDPRSQLRVIVTLRADFYDKPLQYRGFGDLLRKRLETVLPLSDEELKLAIETPAGQVGAFFEGGLVDAIVKDVGEHPGMLPLLQYALTELFERRQGGMLTLSAYQAIGGVTGALARRAEELYNGLALNGQETVRQLFFRLVTLGEGAEDTRRRVLQSELNPSTILDEVIALYGQARLLTFDRDPVTRGPTLEVAHEALIRTWKRLREWINQNREGLRTQRQMATSALEWQNAQHEPSYLASGIRLEQFKSFAESTNLQLNALEQEYLVASMAYEREVFAADEARKAREAKTAQRAQNFQRAALGLGVAAVIAVIATIGAGFAFVSATNQAATATVSQGQAEQRLVDVGTEVSAILTPIPPTLTAVALQIAEGQAQLESLQLAAAITGELNSANPDVERAALLAIEVMRLDGGSFGERLLRIASGRVTGSELLIGQATTVYSATFSADGALILTGSSDGTARLWNANTGAILNTLTGHSGVINAVSFSPDGRFAVTDSFDGTRRVWDTVTGDPLLILSGVASLAFSADGRYVATGAYDGIAYLWSLETGATIHTLEGHFDLIESVAFSPDSRFVATGSGDTMVRIWDVATGENVRTLEGHTLGIRTVAYHPTEALMMTSAWDDTVKLWDSESGEIVTTIENLTINFNEAQFLADGNAVVTKGYDAVQVWSLTGELMMRFQGVAAEADERVFNHPEAIQSAIISPDGRFLVTTENNGSVYLWDFISGTQLHEFTAHSAQIDTMQFNQDGLLLTAGQDQTVRLWHLERGELLHTFEGHTAPVYAVGFSRDGKTILSAGLDQTVRRWSVQAIVPQVLTGHSRWSSVLASSSDGAYFLTSGLDMGVILWGRDGVMRHRLEGHADSIIAAMFSADGRYVLTGGRDRAAIVWDVASGEVVHRLEGHDSTVYAVLFSPDGSDVLTVSGDSSLRLWSLETGETRQTYRATSALIPLSASFNADGTRILATGLGGDALIWDVVTGEVVQTFSGLGDTVDYAGFSRDGQYALTGGWDNLARVWDVASGEIVFTMGETQSMEQFARAMFSSDGQFALTGHVDNAVRLWDVASGEGGLILRGHTARILGMDFSADDRYVITWSQDGTTRLWDVASGETLAVYEWAAPDLTTSTDGRFVLMSADDGLARVWQINTPDTLIASLCQRVTRDLTDAERENYDLAMPVCRS